VRTIPDNDELKEKGATMSKQNVRTRRATSPNINIRVKRHTRALIDRAAATTDKTVTEFVLDAACREAEDVLLDRRLFNLDTTAHQAFVAALDAPTQSNADLKALLSRKPLWEN
jgi:uncharacterized protein (DUF1778 family)